MECKQEIKEESEETNSYEDTHKQYEFCPEVIFKEEEFMEEEMDKSNVDNKDVEVDVRSTFSSDNMILHKECVTMENFIENSSAVEPNFRLPLILAEEALKMVLVPHGDDSEDESEDLEPTAILAPPNKLDVNDYSEENEAAIQELARSSQIQLEHESESDHEEISLSALVPSDFNRHKMHGNLHWRKSKFNQPEDISWKDSLQIDNSWRTFTPLEFFKVMFDDALFQHITDQTNIYSLQKREQELGLKTNELKIFIGILLKLGLVSAPSYRYFWKTTSRYSAIADAMVRDKFEEIKSFIHFNDNTENHPREHPEYDKLFRIRPVIESIRSKLLEIPQEEHQTIGMQMIPTKAHCSLKQYTPPKTHKWGYKVITRAGESGFIYDFLVYTGKDCIKDDENVGVASAYVLKLTENVPRNFNYKIYFDNWFSSVSLVEVLNARGILCLSTVEPNRLKGLRLKDESELKREGRESFDYSVEQNTQSIAIKWYDKEAIHLLSNYAGVEPSDTCSKWDRIQRTQIEVTRPFAVQEYNKYMGGVDLSNKLIDLYRIKFTPKKWYMHIFFYLLDLSVVNSWLLYRRVKSNELGGKTLSLLDFREDVALGLINSSFTRLRGRPSTYEEPTVKKRRMGCHPPDSTRLDQSSHWPDWTNKPQRCKNCIKAQSKVQCMKCGVNLCCTKARNCFYEYHKK